MNAQIDYDPNADKMLDLSVTVPRQKPFKVALFIMLVAVPWLVGAVVIISLFLSSVFSLSVKF